MTDATVHFDIQVQPPEKLVMQMTALGVRPYVNTEIEMDAEENLTFIIRAGGGVSTDPEAVRDELAEFFDGLAVYLRAGTVTVETPADPNVIDGEVIADETTQED